MSHQLNFARKELSSLKVKLKLKRNLSDFSINFLIIFLFARLKDSNELAISTRENHINEVSSLRSELNSTEVSLVTLIKMGEIFTNN